MLNIFEKIYYPIWRKVIWIFDIPREIKYFFQRGIRGYSDRDIWALDDYLCSWLPKALRQMKDCSGCHPDFYDVKRKIKKYLRPRKKIT